MAGGGGDVGGMEEEARQLEHHRGQLESRMKILEDHNRQLEGQLRRLRTILNQVNNLLCYTC